jgi:glycosyltransferase involved in cell wall biosynthesis
VGNIPKENIFFANSGLAAHAFDFITKAEFFRQLVFSTSSDFDLYHSPYMFLPPMQKNRPNVVTVHDLINIKYHQGISGTLRRQLLINTLNRADYYICISNSTRNELLNLFPAIESDRIFVIHQGIDSDFFLRKSTESLQANFENSPYLFYVGQRGGYKNFNALVDFLASSKRTKQMSLICAGGGAFSPEEKKILQQKGLVQRVSHSGYVSMSGLQQLYRNAVALLYPSLEEGFGLPILEAMACNCPVITGNFSSMKEVAGQHAILLSDYSVDAIEAGVEQAQKITSLELSDARTYSENFTWEKTATATLDAYATIIQRH